MLALRQRAFVTVTLCSLSGWNTKKTRLKAKGKKNKHANQVRWSRKWRKFSLEMPFECGIAYSAFIHSLNINNHTIWHLCGESVPAVFYSSMWLCALNNCDIHSFDCILYTAVIILDWLVETKETRTTFVTFTFFDRGNFLIDRYLPPLLLSPVWFAQFLQLFDLISFDETTQHLFNDEREHSDKLQKSSQFENAIDLPIGRCTSNRWEMAIKKATAMFLNIIIYNEIHLYSSMDPNDFTFNCLLIVHQSHRKCNNQWLCSLITLSLLFMIHETNDINALLHFPFLFRYVRFGCNKTISVRPLHG